jgi:hypothetical protein
LCWRLPIIDCIRNVKPWPHWRVIRAVFPIPASLTRTTFGSAALAAASAQPEILLPISQSRFAHSPDILNPSQSRRDTDNKHSDMITVARDRCSPPPRVIQFPIPLQPSLHTGTITTFKRGSEQEGPTRAPRS